MHLALILGEGIQGTHKLDQEHTALTL
nr:hyp [Cotesia vestalis bracovirus]